MLYLVRHGSTWLNADDGPDPRDYFRGWTNQPLSALGMHSAQEIANWVAAHLKIHRLISSDLQRAKQTAYEIGRGSHLNVELDPRLRPWNVGLFTGQLITAEKHKAMEVYQKPENRNKPLAGGEPFGVFLQRWGSALKQYLQEAKSQNILLVAHHRNTLTAPHIMSGGPIKTSGPPAPGGVAEVRDDGHLVELFAPAPPKKLVKTYT